MGSRSDARLEQQMRELLREGANKRCIDCDIVGTQYAVVGFNVFVCTQCSGAHRQFGHRVKGVSMSSFKPEEVAALKESGNAAFAQTYLARWDGRPPRPTDRSAARVTDWIRAVFEERRFLDERAAQRHGGVAPSPASHHPTTRGPDEVPEPSSPSQEARDLERAIQASLSEVGSVVPRGGAPSPSRAALGSAFAAPTPAAAPPSRAGFGARAGFGLVGYGSSGSLPAFAAQAASTTTQASLHSNAGSNGHLAAPMPTTTAAVPASSSLAAVPTFPLPPGTLRAAENKSPEPAPPAPPVRSLLETSFTSSPAPALALPADPFAPTTTSAAHTAPATSAGWAAFDEPEGPVGGTGAVTTEAIVASASKPVSPEDAGPTGWDTFHDDEPAKPESLPQASAASPATSTAAPASSVGSPSPTKAPGAHSSDKIAPKVTPRREAVPLDVFFPEFERIKRTGMLPTGQPVPPPGFPVVAGANGTVVAAWVPGASGMHPATARASALPPAQPPAGYQAGAHGNGYGPSSPAHNGYGASAHNGYGGPAHNSYGAPTHSGYGGPAHNGYGAPPANSYGAPVTNGYGAPVANGSTHAPYAHNPPGALAIPSPTGSAPRDAGQWSPSVPTFGHPADSAPPSARQDLSAAFADLTIPASNGYHAPPAHLAPVDTGNPFA